MADSPLALDKVRSQFPALASGFAFLENAGGSQVPIHVLDRMNELMLKGYVQTGAGYPAADFVDDIVARAKQFANVLMNGEGVGLTVIGPSTTDLLYRLSNSIAHQMTEGDNVVVSVANHESNIGPWLRLQERGATVRWWNVSHQTGEHDFSDLERLVDERTKVVAAAHTSNLLGEILDVHRIADIAHRHGALAVIDGVANAPHQAPDVRAIGADFYVLSLYKVFGPHVALLFGKSESWQKVKGPNHFFIADNDLPWKFELGCQPYEALAGLLGVGDYFSFLAGQSRPTHDRPTVEAAYARIKELELPVLETIGSFLVNNDRIRLVGPHSHDQATRHPTFSFVHKTAPSDQIVKAINGPDLGIRFGHMYAARLCEALGVPVSTGVVRISAVHYNSPEEAERLSKKLDTVIGSC